MGIFQPAIVSLPEEGQEKKHERQRKVALHLGANSQDAGQLPLKRRGFRRFSPVVIFAQRVWGGYGAL